MALNFPDSPSVNDVYDDSTTGFSYQWDGTIWKTYVASKLSFNENDYLKSAGTGNINSTGIITATSFVKTSGTSSQFLKADGSVDSSVYITSADGGNADQLDGQEGSYYLDYNNFSNTPTIPTNNNQLTNGAGYITSADGGNAATLDSLDSTQFLRSDAADTKTSGDLTFNDSIKANFGTGGDLQIYHDGSNSYIVDAGTGNLIMKSAGSFLLQDAVNNENMFVANRDGSVELWYDNSKKLETTTSGVTVTGDVNSTSDINLKKDIEVITSSTEILNQLRGVKFTWKETETKSVGVIAQEVEAILPELVKGEEGNKSVNYSGLVGVLIEAVKEQQKQIDTLTKRIEELGG